MKKSGLVLTITAIALASIAAYLLYSLDVERGRAARTAQTAPAPADGVVELPGVTLRTHTRTTVNGVPLRTSSGARTPEERREHAPAIENAEDNKARQRRQAAEYLRRYEDPAGRADLHEHELDVARRSTAGLDQRLNLEPAQYERLVQLLADREMERHVAAARCAVNPLCLSPSLDSSLFTSSDQAIRDIIGDENMKELREFRNAEVERRIVSGLQTRLPVGASLTQTQTEDLTRALYQEKREQQHAMYQSQQHVRGYGLPNGAHLFYADNAPTPEAALQSGEAYVQAMRDRAATVLQGNQLMAFNEMQEDLLIGFRRYMRQQAPHDASGGDRTP